MTDYNYDEKRNFSRMKVETQVTFTIKNADNITYHGTSNDLSATGLAMTTDHELAVGDEIEIIMSAGSDRLPPFVADGKVLRVEKNDNDIYEVSISLEVKQA